MDDDRVHAHRTRAPYGDTAPNGPRPRRRWLPVPPYRPIYMRATGPRQRRVVRPMERDVGNDGAHGHIPRLLYDDAAGDRCRPCHGTGWPTCPALRCTILTHGDAWRPAVGGRGVAMQGRGTPDGGAMLTDDSIGAFASREPPVHATMSSSPVRCSAPAAAVRLATPSTGRRASGGISPSPRAPVYGAPGSGGGRTDRRRCGATGRSGARRTGRAEGAQNRRLTLHGVSWDHVLSNASTVPPLIVKPPLTRPPSITGSSGGMAVAVVLEGRDPSHGRPVNGRVARTVRRREHVASHVAHGMRH